PVGQSGAGEAAVELFARHFRLQDRTHCDQLFDVDTGGKTFALAQEREVLEHDVAGSAGRERATAEAAERAVENPRAGVERRRGVGDAHAAGVVQMYADRL